MTGLCVGRDWVGDPARGIEPWRDSGVAVRGPAVAALEDAFAQMWALAGPAPPAASAPAGDRPAPAGHMAVRVIASAPGTAALYRLMRLIAAAARRTLWLTDAYYAGTSGYVQALRAAAQDGDYVRLLVPGRGSDIRLVQAISRAGYRALLALPQASVLVVCHEIPVRYAVNAAGGSDDLDGPVHDIVNAVPYLFDERGLQRAAAGIERLVG